MASPELSGYWFDVMRSALKRIRGTSRHMRRTFAGVTLILDLMREVQRLRNEMRTLEV